MGVALTGVNSTPPPYAMAVAGASSTVTTMSCRLVPPCATSSIRIRRNNPSCVSLRWLYNSIPALEDVDIVARVQLLDPDGIPGNGDEFFETVASGGFEVAVGEADVRKEKLDQIFKTTLVISF